MEFAVKGAIFPNFLIGYLDHETGNLILNPHFKDTALFKNSVSIRHLIVSGFPIDQSNFDTIHSNSEYNRIVYHFYNGIYRDRKS